MILRFSSTISSLLISKLTNACMKKHLPSVRKKRIMFRISQQCRCRFVDISKSPNSQKMSFSKSTIQKFTLFTTNKHRFQQINPHKQTFVFLLYFNYKDEYTNPTNKWNLTQRTKWNCLLLRDKNKSWFAGDDFRDR